MGQLMGFRIVLRDRERPGVALFLRIQPPEQGGSRQFAGKRVAAAGSDQRARLRRVRIDAPSEVFERAIGPGFCPVLYDTLAELFLERLHLHQADPQTIAFAAIGPVTGVDVGRQDGESHAARFGDIGEGRIKSALVADDRCDKFRRIVRAQIGGFERDLRIAGRMGFAETVACEAHDHRPNFVDGVRRRPVLGGATAELLMVIPQLPRLMLLADDLAQLIRVFQGKVGERHGHLRDVFLVDHDAVGFLQHVVHQWMQRLIRMAMGPPDEVVHEGDGRRPHERRHHDEIVEDVRHGEPVRRHAAP